MTTSTPRRTLVTGAGSGLGRAIAEALAVAGDQVIGTVRDPERARALTAAARERKLSLEFRPLEITQPAQVDALAAALLSEGGVDLLVHNAGSGVFGPIEEVDAEATARQFAVNLFGPLQLTRALLPGLRERKGRIVFIGSLAGRLALPFQAHYSATKAALASLSDALRMELKPFGVRVSCVEPGDFATGFTDARSVLDRGASPYQAAQKRCLEAVEQQERGGADAAWVARTVVSLCRQTDPPARVPVGRLARTICLLARLLPDRLREAMVRSTYRQ